MFEKYDGIRAFWNPLRRTFYSMQGKPLPVPQDILDDMPQSSFLDGEMWCETPPPPLFIYNPSLTLTQCKGLGVTPSPKRQNYFLKE